MSVDVNQIADEVKSVLPNISAAFEEIQKVIVGQRNLIEKMMMAMICDGHILVEGLPGLAKTTAVNTFAQIVAASFKRIQFTPDLLPADIVGTQIYSQKDGQFTTKHGPIFANIVLADEINRAPAKVQSALLEAMQERQVTIGENSFVLPKPFLVMATQNPIEQEGTYSLPEAQVDRFMMKIFVGYPTRDEEVNVMKRIGTGGQIALRAVMTLADLQRAKNIVEKIFVDDKLYTYMANLVFATRTPKEYGLSDIASLIAVGSSPRGSLCLLKLAKARAFLSGRGYVTPQDVKSIAHDALRHRVLLTYEAEAQNVTADAIVQRVLDKVDVP